MDIHLFMDSGAFSAWTSGTEIQLEDYIKFCLEYEDMLDSIVNLDVIPGAPNKVNTPQDIEDSAKRGWSNYRAMLKAGIPKEKLIHIYHQGEDIKWLKRMIKDIPYIGLSPANDKTTSQKIEWLDRCMDFVCDDEGMPLVKFHGFAVTSLKMLLRYPWYSVDSTSWVVTGRTGSIYVPRYRDGKWIYDEDSWKIAVSNRSPARSEKAKHFDSLPPKVKGLVLQYLGEHGYVMGKSEFKMESAKHYQLKENERWAEKEKDGHRKVEIIVEKGVSNDYKQRDEINIIYFVDLEASLPPWPLPFKRTGKMGFGL